MGIRVIGFALAVGGLGLWGCDPSPAARPESQVTLEPATATAFSEVAPGGPPRSSTARPQLTGACATGAPSGTPRPTSSTKVKVTHFDADAYGATFTLEPQPSGMSFDARAHSLLATVLLDALRSRAVIEVDVDACDQRVVGARGS